MTPFEIKRGGNFGPAVFQLKKKFADGPDIDMTNGAFIRLSDGTTSRDSTVGNSEIVLDAVNNVVTWTIGESATSALLLGASKATGELWVIGEDNEDREAKLCEGFTVILSTRAAAPA